MTINYSTGWTPATTDLQRANNITDRLKAIVCENAVIECIRYLSEKYGEINADFIREYDYITRAAEDMQSKALEIDSNRNDAELCSKFGDPL